jgi:C-terminal processing protease CtpA/Prc
MNMMAVAILLVGAALSSSARAQSGKVKITPSPRPETELSLVQTSGGGYLGVFLGDVNEERAKELKLTEVRGAVVGQVVEGSPAAKAGLQKDDLILSYNGQRVESAAQVHRLLSETPPGRTVTLGVSRNGAMQNIPVALGERRRGPLGFRPGHQTEDEAMRELAERLREEADEWLRKREEGRARDLLEQSEALRRQAEELRAQTERFRREGLLRGFGGSGRGLSSGRYHLGVAVTPLSEQLAKFFNARGGAGLLVTEVEASSAAERAGLKAGDCITAVNGERVNSAAELQRLISRPGRDEKEVSEVTLTIVRDRNEQAIKVKPERREPHFLLAPQRGRTN